MEREREKITITQDITTLFLADSIPLRVRASFLHIASPHALTPWWRSQWLELLQYDQRLPTASGQR